MSLNFAVFTDFKKGKTFVILNHLILVHVVLKFGFSEFVEGDDDQGDEDVDEEEGEDDEEDDVEDGHLDAEPRLRTFLLVRRGHRVLQNPARYPNKYFS